MRLENCIFKPVCEKSCTDNCIRFLEMNFLLQKSCIPETRQIPKALTPVDLDINSFEALAYIRDNIFDFVDRGNTLYIYSQFFGNGKTTWAIKLMINYFTCIWLGNGFEPRGLFINVPQFLTKCKTVISSPDKDFDEIRRLLPIIDLVIWDDIASQKLTDFDYTNLLSYIDERTLCNKSNIYTGNLDFENLQKAVGNRLASRIWNNNSTIIEFKGGDRR
jgi:DNA replication protein DnaC